MQTQLISSQTMREAAAPQKFTAQYLPLELVNKPNLTTAECAFYLNRRPQTLRCWACLENGPIRPRRISRLLAWDTAQVKALTGLTSGAYEAAAPEQVVA
jgi:hypothetical protein